MVEIRSIIELHMQKQSLRIFGSQLKVWIEEKIEKTA